MSTRTESAAATELPPVQDFTYAQICDALDALLEKQLEPYGLTQREFEIVRLILDGHTYKGIGQILFITDRTVKFHSRNAFDKLGVANRRELLLKFKSG